MLRFDAPSHLQFEPRVPRAAVGRFQAGLPDAVVVPAVGEVADAGEQFQPWSDLPIAREIGHGVGRNLRGDESRAAADRRANRQEREVVPTSAMQTQSA